MKLLVDQQLPVLLATRLTELGHDAAHVKLIGLTDADDLSIGRHARSSEAHVITKDHDFLSFVLADPGSPALIRLAFGNSTNRVLLLKMQAALPDIERRIAEGGRVIEVR